jgi:hypothetical protein
VFNCGNLALEHHPPTAPPKAVEQPSGRACSWPARSPRDAVMVATNSLRRSGGAGAPSHRRAQLPVPRLASPRRREPERLRVRLFSPASRIPRSGRQIVLHLPTHASWAGLPTEAITTLRGCAARADQQPDPTTPHTGRWNRAYRSNSGRTSYPTRENLPRRIGTDRSRSPLAHGGKIRSSGWSSSRDCVAGQATQIQPRSSELFPIWREAADGWFGVVPSG